MLITPKASLEENLAPIYKATYDLVLIIIRFVKNFNREYKYTIGESIKKETIEAITNIYRENSKRDKKEKFRKST
ncbi:MAG: hypothetical protein L3J41_09455 [Melioribacteraceae bacterium]|nr:hypothetical protein [Melioribacteraceae bacterium]